MQIKRVRVLKTKKGTCAYAGLTNTTKMTFSQVKFSILNKVDHNIHLPKLADTRKCQT